MSNVLLPVEEARQILTSASISLSRWYLARSSRIHRLSCFGLMHYLDNVYIRPDSLLFYQ